MDIATEDQPDHLVICPEGPRLDALQALTFKEKLRAATTNANKDVVLDLRHIEFLDSSGLGAIVAIAKLMPEPHQMKFVQLQPLVARVFQLTHMDRVFKIIPNTHSSPDPVV